MSEGVSVIGEPRSSGAFEAGLKDVTMTGFDQAGAYGQIQTQSAGVIELIAAVELRVRVDLLFQHAQVVSHHYDCIIDKNPSEC